MLNLKILALGIAVLGLVLVKVSSLPTSLNLLHVNQKCTANCKPL